MKARIWRALRVAALAATAGLLGLPAGGRAAADVTIALAGSTTLLPFLREAATGYQSDHPGITVTVAGGGSRAALVRLGAGEIDMAASDYQSGDDDLFDHRIAAVGFAFAANPSSGISSLTRRQLRDVLSGAVVNYKQIGGKDLPIAVVQRPSSSGIRELLAMQIMRGRPFAPGGAVDDGTSAVVADVKASPGGIGYATLGGLRDAGLNALAIDGVAPTDESIENGTYPLWAYEYIITKGPATPDQSRFLAYLQTNRTLLDKYGYIAVQDIQRLPGGE